MPAQHAFVALSYTVTMDIPLADSIVPPLHTSEVFGWNAQHQQLVCNLTKLLAWWSRISVVNGTWSRT